MRELQGLPATTPRQIELRGVSKSYRRGKQEVPVLEAIDLDIAQGSFEAFMGPSGSGKTTLLNLIAGIDQPTTGTLRVAGADIARLDDAALSEWRAQNIGFVFQFYNLIPVLTAFENVEMPLFLRGLAPAERRERAAHALKLVGLQERMHHYPRQLSGGQEQRVAIARAIVTDPPILIADEPTGDLDRASAVEVLKLMAMLHEHFGKTIIMVTHDPVAAKYARTVRHLDKGTLVTSEPS